MEATPGTVPAFQLLFFIGTQGPSPGHLEALKPTALGGEFLEKAPLSKLQGAGTQSPGFQ